jgi:outer membrane lipoprotein SlyB
MKRKAEKQKAHNTSTDVTNISTSIKAAEPTKLQRLADSVVGGASGAALGVIVTQDVDGGVAVIADGVFEWRGSVTEWQAALRVALVTETRQQT